MVFMKKSNSMAFMLAAVSLLASGVFISCSGGGDPADGTGEWKWKKIVRSDINEAHYIFSTPDGSMYPSSRASTTHSGFGAVDVNGMVKDIQFFNEDGELIKSAQPTIIHGIADVNEEYVICGITLFQDVRYEFEDGEGISTKSLFCNLLINKATGKVYMFPNKYDNEAWRYEPGNSLIRWEEDVKAYSDAQGNLYLGYYNEQFKISKIDVHDLDNISLEDYLPPTEMDNLAFYSNEAWPFLVNASGTCAYRTRPPQNASFNPNDYIKFKCPGGRIYPIRQLLPEGDSSNLGKYDSYNYHLFLGYNGHYYIATLKREEKMDISTSSYTSTSTLKIYKLSEPTNNEILSEEVAQLIIPGYLDDGAYIQYSVGNPEKHTRFWSLGGKLVEFSENENSVIRDATIEMPRLDGDTRLFYTAGAVYLGQSSFQRLTQLSFKNYSDRKIVDFQKEGYEAYSITSSISSPDLSFTGLRYADANYVLGTVEDATGSLNCLESTAFVNEKTILIRMN